MTQQISQRRKIEVAVAGPSREYQSQGYAVTFVPLSIKRKHIRKLLIAPPGQVNTTVRSSFELPMIRTIGKAFYWQKLLDSGEVANAKELARRLKLDPGWVTEVLRLTRLAPDILQAIVDGRQPRHMNLHLVRGRQTEVPLDWDEQRRLFGFSPVT